MENKKYCTNCSKEMNEHAEICTACGVREGKVIKYCYSCGNEINENQELCLSCGVNPRKKKKISNPTTNSIVKGNINIILATILGFMLPGLPSILWFDQKKKGASLLVGYFVLWALLPVFTFILCPIAGIDAYRLSKKVNDGESLGEWDFF